MLKNSIITNILSPDIRNPVYTEHGQYKHILKSAENLQIKT